MIKVFLSLHSIPAQTGNIIITMCVGCEMRFALRYVLPIEAEYSPKHASHLSLWIFLGAKAPLRLAHVNVNPKKFQIAIIEEG